jgi:broad specificity phosphatase PhoE
MFEIDLIRHVKVDGKSALYGCTDISPLQQDNDALLKRLVANQNTSNAYQLIICSPLQRCKTLATKLAGQCHLPIEVIDDLQEMNFGLFDGIPFDDMAFELANTPRKNDDEEHGKVRWSLLEEFFKAPAKIQLPEAELLADFNCRVIQAWTRIIEQQFLKLVLESELARENEKPHIEVSKTKPGRVLLIAHGGVIRMILAHILQLDWRQASWHQQLTISNASLSRVCINQPYVKDKATPKLADEFYRTLHQQVTTISMPLLQEIL